jgi:hypothetical protein
MTQLNSFGWQLHNQQFRPKQFKELQRSFQLMPFLKNLQDRLNDPLTSLEQDGLRPDEA